MNIKKITVTLKSFFKGEKVRAIYFPVGRKYFLQPMTERQRHKLITLTGEDWYATPDCDLSEAEATLLIFYMQSNIPVELSLIHI